MRIIRPVSTMHIPARQPRVLPGPSVCQPLEPPLAIAAVLDMRDEASVVNCVHLSDEESEKIRVVEAEFHGSHAPADEARSPS